jgi:hypothetical protein
VVGQPNAFRQVRLKDETKLAASAETVNVTLELRTQPTVAYSLEKSVEFIGQVEAPPYRHLAEARLTGPPVNGTRPYELSASRAGLR